MNYWNKENKAARKSTSRAHRRANRKLARQLRHDVDSYANAPLPVSKGTQGRLTH